MEKYILHIDANSAYLSWIAAWRMNNGSKVDLREIPSVVGGNEKSRHGIVLAQSMPAKKFGIKTGEPLMSVRQKCPNITIVPPNYSLFAKASQAMYELIYEYSPMVQRFSVDECFVEIVMDGGKTDILTLAHEIKDRIHKELGHTVNIGCSKVKILAKMASDFEKPNKVHTLWKEEIQRKMWPLPVGDLFMVGRSTETTLKNLGIHTIGELAKADAVGLEKHLKSYVYLIQAYANGMDSTPVRMSNRLVVKGVGNGTTAPYNVDNSREAYLFIRSLAESVSMRLRKLKSCARLVAVGITSTEFISRTRQRKLNVAIDTTTYISKIACELFDELWDGKPVRKFRVRVSELTSNEYVQLSLLEEYDFDRQKKIDTAVDQIRGKYGNHAIQRASFIESNIKPVMGGVGEEEEYPLMTSML